MFENFHLHIFIELYQHEWILIFDFSLNDKNSVYDIGYVNPVLFDTEWKILDFKMDVKFVNYILTWQFLI